MDGIEQLAASLKGLDKVAQEPEKAKAEPEKPVEEVKTIAPVPVPVPVPEKSNPNVSGKDAGIAAPEAGKKEDQASEKEKRIAELESKLAAQEVSMKRLALISKMTAKGMDPKLSELLVDGINDSNEDEVVKLIQEKTKPRTVSVVPTPGVASEEKMSSRNSFLAGVRSVSGFGRK